MSKSKKTWCFQEQLKIGNKAEQKFLELYPQKLVFSEDRKYDFLVEDTNEKLELKTDSYDMDKTENFFFERFSNKDKETPGGPWRAAEDKVDIFVYYFSKNDTYFEFRDLKNLLKKVEKLTEKKGQVFIKNRAWITSGWKVKREDVKEFFIERKVSK